MLGFILLNNLVLIIIAVTLASALYGISPISGGSVDAGRILPTGIQVSTDSSAQHVRVGASAPRATGDITLLSERGAGGRFMLGTATDVGTPPQGGKPRCLVDVAPLAHSAGGAGGAVRMSALAGNGAIVVNALGNLSTQNASRLGGMEWSAPGGTLRLAAARYGGFLAGPQAGDSSVMHLRAVGTALRLAAAGGVWLDADVRARSAALRVPGGPSAMPGIVVAKGLLRASQTKAERAERSSGTMALPLGSQLMTHGKTRLDNVSIAKGSLVIMAGNAGFGSGPSARLLFVRLLLF